MLPTGILQILVTIFFAKEKTTWMQPDSEGNKNKSQKNIIQSVFRICYILGTWHSSIYTGEKAYIGLKISTFLHTLHNPINLLLVVLLWNIISRVYAMKHLF